VARLRIAETEYVQTAGGLDEAHPNSLRRLAHIVCYLESLQDEGVADFVVAGCHKILRFGLLAAETTPKL
jgi:hypothetical protein